MKNIFAILILLLSASTVRSQYNDTYQPDSIYKVNKIKSRTIMFNYNKFFTRFTTNYDRNGRMIEWIFYDTTGLKYYDQKKFEYDSSGKLIRETYFDYRKYDSVTKKKVLLPVPYHITVSFLEYDSLNRIRTRKYGNSRDSFYESSFNYETHVLQEKYSDKLDSVSGERTTYFEKPNIEKRSIGFNNFTNGKKITWEFLYTNKFDKQGNILKRKIDFKNYLDNSGNKGPRYKEILYKYLSNGLMVERISTNPVKKDDYDFTLIFDYKFW